MDAILDYTREPGRFDPARRVPLERFLLVPAIRNLLNRFEHEGRRRALEQQFVAHVRREACMIELPLNGAARPDQLRDSILAVALNDHERMAILILLEAPGNTAAIARALGVAFRPVAEQRRHAKQFRDRIIKRVRRSLVERRGKNS